MILKKLKMFLLMGMVLVCTMGAIAAADVNSDSNAVDLKDSLSGYNPLHPVDDGRVMLSSDSVNGGSLSPHTSDKLDHDREIILSDKFLGGGEPPKHSGKKITPRYDPYPRGPSGPEPIGPLI